MRFSGKVRPLTFAVFGAALVSQSAQAAPGSSSAAPAACHAGSVEIRADRDIAVLKDVSCIDGALRIVGTSLVDLRGLDKLTKVRGELYIADNPNLARLDGLESLKIVKGQLAIARNPVLTSIAGLKNLTRAEVFAISLNPMLASLAGLGEQVRVEEVYIYKNQKLKTLRGLEGIAELDKLKVEETSLQSLRGLDNLSVIHGTLSILRNSDLETLEGLENLKAVKGKLAIGFNPKLSSLAGLKGLTAVEGMFAIDNPRISGCQACEVIARLKTRPDRGRIEMGAKTDTCTKNWSQNGTCAKP
jgi:hypothetical protein